MKNDYEFDYNDKPVCPHCKHVEQDSWEWGNEETGETDCGSCCKPFNWTQHVSVTWSTSIAYLKASKFVRMYEKGIITLLNMFDTVIEECDPKSIEELGKYKEEFLTYLNKKPKTQEEWDRVISVGSSCSTGDAKPLTQEEVRAFRKKHVERWREALKNNENDN